MAKVKPVPMEPFTLVFAAAVVIFFTMFLLFGQEPMTNFNESIDVPEKGDVIFSADYVSLISNKTQSARTIDFGDFNVGYTSTEKNIQDIKTLKLEKGIFKSSSKEFSFDGAGMESVLLEFTVVDTNNYGNLRVYVNDELVFDNKTVKDAKFKVEVNDIIEHNEVRIEVQSSGVRFWAPTTYLLSDVKLSAASFDNIDKMYSFLVYDYEMAGFNAQLSYEVGSGSVRLGDLQIEINGNEVNEEKRPMFGTIYKENFDRADGIIAAKPDSNYIKFYADSDSTYELEDTQLIITYFDTDKEAVKEYTIFIDEDTYDDMDNKTIVLEYYADKISSDALLDISLNDNILNVETALYENKIVLTQDDFRMGKTNILKFSTYGIYKLSDIDLRIAYDQFKLF